MSTSLSESEVHSAFPPPPATFSHQNNQIENIPLLDPREALFLEKMAAIPITGEINHYKIVPGTYEHVLDILEVEDKELWEFINFESRHEVYDDNCIVFKMSASRIHGMVCTLLSNEIRQGCMSMLENHETDQITKDLINEIVEFGESQMLLKSKTKLLPDNHWGLKEAEPPGVILEIAYTQPFSQVKKKAMKYFIGSNFQVRLVIALNVKKESGIGLSVWKSATTMVNGKEGKHWFMKEIKEQEQIEKEGGLAEEGHLTIELGCFGPVSEIKRSFKDADVHREIRIPYSKIVGLVKVARESYNSQRLGDATLDDCVLIAESGDERGLELDDYDSSEEDHSEEE